MAERAGKYPQELLDAAESLTRLAAADESFDTTMSRLAELAVEAIEGADECCISLATAGGEQLKTVASTSGTGDQIDQLQRETGEGPCKSSIKNHATFRIPNMEEDETWPTFSKKAAGQTGIRSILSFVLRLSDQETGALNMLSTKLDAFSEDDADTGTLFAAQAAVAMADALGHAHDEEKIDQLEEGLMTRQLIGQAVGILMATRSLDSDGAFDVLRKASQTSNIKLREIAERVVDRAQDL